MKLYSYVVNTDRGLAPNPFWGYCTLAVCTPNHMGIKAEKGDWIIGTSPKKWGNKLVFSMQVSEILPFESYYLDARFEKKKPDKNRTWDVQCGDNMYYKDQNEKYRQHPTNNHLNPEDIAKDLKYPFVFISEHFYYFGDKAESIPSEYQDLIWKRQGVKGHHDPAVVDSFLKWLKEKFDMGVHGTPKDNIYKTTSCDQPVC